MAYAPRPLTAYICPYCQLSFTARHDRRQYCGASCRVRASYARTGRRPSPGSAALAGLENSPPLPAAVVVALPPPLVPSAPSPPAAEAVPRPAPALAPPSAPTPAPGHWLLLACQSFEQALRRRQADERARAALRRRVLFPDSER